MLHQHFHLRMNELDTPRLHLRALTLDDTAELNVVNSHPEVMRYIGPVESSVDDTRRYLKQGPLADYQKYGLGRHACIDKNSGRLIGFCGLKYLPELNEVDIGYRFLPEYWGQGLATETSLIMMQHGREVIGLKRIIGLALPENTGSRRIMEKLGMGFEKEVVSKGDHCVLYAWGADHSEQPVPLFSPPATL